MVKIKAQTVRALPSGELKTAYFSTPSFVTHTVKILTTLKDKMTKI